MVFTRRPRIAFGAFLLATAAVPAIAVAQEAPAPETVQGSPQASGPVAAADDVTPAEIVVTATKQSLSLGDVPAAITALTADDLGPGGVEDIGDLQAQVPNLSIGEQFGVNRTFIRGIGMTSIDLGADGAVAFLQDGAMIARPAAQLAGFYDLEQVEILRGPQGTIYGRGATAGAINLVTKKPTDELDGYARATYGNYDALTFEGAVGGPIAGDRLMARIAGKRETRDGFGKNLVTGSDVDDRDAYALRGSVVGVLSEQLKATAIVDYFKEDDNNYAFHYFGPSVVPEDMLAHNLIGGRTIFDFYAAQGKKPNLRNIFSNEDPINERDGIGATGIIDWTGDQWSVKSTTAYRDFDRFNRTDLDVSDVWMFGQNNYTEESKTFSQEFTVNYEGEGFRLLGGAMYFNEKLFGEVRVPTVNLAVLFNVLAPGLNLPANFFDAGNYLQRGTVKIDAYGAFLQGTVDLTETLRLTAGARYNYEKRDGNGRFTFEAQQIDIPTDKEKGWDAITPKLLVEWEPTEETLIYGTITRGFKSGVINVGSINSVIDPEYVWNYEAGFKQRLGRGLLASGAAFYYDYKDLQVGFVNANSIVETINAASARNYGAELELTGRVTDQLSVNAFASYLNAKFTKFCTGYYGAAVPRPGISYPACPTDPALVSLKDRRLPNAPEWSFGIGGTYTLPVGAAGELVFNGDLAWQDKVFFTEFNNIDARQDSFAMINASLSFQSADDRWSITGWVKNLADKFVIANNIVAAPLFGSVRVGSVMPPRTYGVTLGYNF